MYTLKFLSSDDFDRLPYDRVSTSLGVADRGKGEAYVRDTASIVDVFTAMHELEHLKGDDLGEHESPDEDGIYYKDSGKLIQTIGPAIAPFTGPFAPAVLAASQGGGGAMSANRAAKKQNSAMLDQQRAMQGGQGGMMGQFLDQGPTQGQGSPAVSMVGGGGSNAMSGSGGGGGIGDRIRQLLMERSKGFYSGRGGF